MISPSLVVTTSRGSQQLLGNFLSIPDRVGSSRMPSMASLKPVHRTGTMPTLDAAMPANATTSSLPLPGEEFDFADVFGPMPDSAIAPLSSTNSGEQEPSGRPLLPTGEAEAQRLQDWAPAGSIPEGDVPFIITHRAHSMVGPAVTPRHSLSRMTSSRLGPREEAAGALPPSETPGDALGEVSSAVEAWHIASSQAARMPRISSVESFTAEAVPTGAAASSKVGPDSFELLRVVGQGAFGKVFQVQHKESQEILAMKVMRKDRILERNQGGYMQAERDILTKVVHPFIVQLHYSFQTKSKLYLLLEFVNGGHLFFQLYRQGTFSEDLARIYAAELVLAVGHLHSMGIMHRDLKPENILLDSDGHIKLTDFGLAKEFHASDPSNSLCGTMEYMAPEIIQAKGHGPAADFWSIGVLIFEMLVGMPPFSAHNRQKLQHKIIKDKIKFPSFLTSDAHSILKGLLQKDPSKRLGSGSGGVDELKSHKWFKCINWSKLLQKDIQPKFRPTVNGKHCIANFDEMWTKLPVHDSPASTPPSVDLSFFRNYSYVAPNLLQLPTVESDSEEETPSDEVSPTCKSPRDFDEE